MIYIRESEIKSKEIGKLLSERGFERVRIRGSHQIWSDGSRTISLTIPTVNRMVAKRIVKTISAGQPSMSV